ncbi:MAG: hypothetical protein U5L08_01565 [Xanthomonadales bacterium]|nr:hypothetical protein [Xanthomonadales bacterium]
MPKIVLRNLWTDSDGMLQPQLTVASDHHMMVQDFYTYPEDLEQFAAQLISYAGNRPVIFEYGSAREVYCHLKLSVVPLDDLGHSAFAVAFDNRRKPPEAASGSFFAACEPGNVNQFGRRLSTWLNNSGSVLEHERPGA